MGELVVRSPVLAIQILLSLCAADDIPPSLNDDDEPPALDDEPPALDDETPPGLDDEDIPPSIDDGLSLQPRVFLFACINKTLIAC